jgi:hypothetical protein
MHSITSTSLSIMCACWDDSNEVSAGRIAGEDVRALPLSVIQAAVEVLIFFFKHLSWT